MALDDEQISLNISAMSEVDSSTLGTIVKAFQKLAGKYEHFIETSPKAEKIIKVIAFIDFKDRYWKYTWLYDLNERKTKSLHIVELNSTEYMTEQVEEHEKAPPDHYRLQFTSEES